MNSVTVATLQGSIMKFRLLQEVTSDFKKLADVRVSVENVSLCKAFKGEVS